MRASSYLIKIQSSIITALDQSSSGAKTATGKNKGRLENFARSSSIPHEFIARWKGELIYEISLAVCIYHRRLTTVSNIFLINIHFITLNVYYDHRFLSKGGFSINNIISSGKLLLLSHEPDGICNSNINIRISSTSTLMLQFIENTIYELRTRDSPRKKNLKFMIAAGKRGFEWKILVMLSKAFNFIQDASIVKKTNLIALQSSFWKAQLDI